MPEIRVARQDTSETIKTIVETIDEKQGNYAETPHENGRTQFSLLKYVTTTLSSVKDFFDAKISSRASSIEAQAIKDKIGSPNPTQGNMTNVMNGLKLIHDDMPEAKTTVLEWESSPVEVGLWDPIPIQTFELYRNRHMTGAIGCYYKGYFYIGGNSTKQNSFMRYKAETLNDRWEILPDAPVTLNLYNFCFSYNDHIYWLGSYPATLNQFWRYNINLRIWERMADTPVASAYYGRGAFINGILYVVGMTTVPNSLYSYNPITNTWSSPLAAPGFNASNAAVAVYNNELYVFGTTVNQSVKYNPSTNIWIPLANPVTTSIGGWGCLIDSKIYIMGPTTTFKSYDIPNNTWEALPALPITIASRLGLTDGTLLYYFGLDANYLAVASQNPKLTTTWSYLWTGYMPTLPSNPSFVRKDNIVYIGGSATNLGQLATFDLISHDIGWEIPATSQLIAPPADLRNACAFEYKNELYFIGATVATAGTGNIFRKYNLVTKIWANLPNVPGNTLRSQAIVNNDEVYVLQGNTGGTGFWKYNFANNVWITLPATVAMLHVVAELYDDKIYTIQVNNVRTYDFSDGNWRLITDRAIAARLQTTGVAGTAIVGLFEGVIPIVILTPGNIPSSTLDEDDIYIITDTASQPLLKYSIPDRIGKPISVPPVAPQNGGLFVMNDWLYLVSPIGVAGAGYPNIYRCKLREMAWEPDILTPIKQGQEIFYTTTNNNLFLTFDNVRIASNTKWQAYNDGFIVTDWSKSVKGKIRAFLT
ncbi:MAG: hypothetical protein FWC41_00495 [Firmicutes bacterium]|nr:hypothetical protein [Bacillota bacterium]